MIIALNNYAGMLRRYETTMANQERPEILKAKEACELLRISQDSLYQNVKKGKIPGIKIGGQWRFSRKKLIDLLQEGDIQ